MVAGTAEVQNMIFGLSWSTGISLVTLIVVLLTHGWSEMVKPREVEQQLRGRLEGKKLANGNSRLEYDLFRANPPDSLVQRLLGRATFSPQGHITAEATLYPKAPAEGVEYDLDHDVFQQVCEEEGVTAEYEIVKKRPEEDKADVKIRAETMNAGQASDFFRALDRAI